MPSYRGIDRDAVYSSIIAARDFLRRHSTGPHLDAHLAKVDDAALAQIASAADDRALVQAVATSGVEGNFVWIAQLLRFHTAANTSGRGRAVMAALDKWGAAHGARAAVGTSVDSEIDKYIARRPFNRLKAAFYARTAFWRNEGPFDRYCLVIDDLTQRRVNWTDPAVSRLLDAVSEKLRPFYDLMEVESLGIGLAGGNAAQRPEPQGIIFTTTRRAAQAVADAFPQMRVVDGRLSPLPPASALPKSNQSPRI